MGLKRSLIEIMSTFRWQTWYYQWYCPAGRQRKNRTPEKSIAARNSDRSSDRADIMKNYRVPPPGPSWDSHNFHDEQESR